MALHKDTQGNIHDDMNGTALNYLPTGCVLITDAEAGVIHSENQAKAQAEYEATLLTYQQKRFPEYPPMADYLDAIVKGDTVGQKAYVDACLAVKEKYPKL